MAHLAQTHLSAVRRGRTAVGGRRRSAGPYGYLAPALVLLGLFVLWPLLELIGLSFTRWDGYGPITFAGLATWGALLADSGFLTALRHSLLWLALTAGCIPLLGFFIAVVVSRSASWLRSTVQAIIITPLLLPPAVAAVTWGIILNPLFGPLNATLRAVHLSPLGLDWLGDPHVALWTLYGITVWSTIGLSVLVFAAAIDAIDPTYLDLARAEGAGFWWELRAVVVPAVRPAAGLALVVTAVLAAQVFDLVFILTNGGPADATTMLGLDMYNRAFGGGNVSAGAAVATVEIGIGLLLAGGAVLIVRGSTGMRGSGELGHGATRARYGGTVAASLPSLCAGVVGVLVLAPLLWDVIVALSAGRAAALRPLGTIWQSPSLNAFSLAWQGGMGTGVWESAIIAVIVVALTLAVGVPAAFAAALRRLPRGVVAALLAALVFTLLQPREVLLIPLFYLLDQLHLLDSAVGLALVEAARELPFTILLLWAAMRATPAEVLGAAEIEAGRGLRLLWHIVLPLSRPALAAAALWVFVTSWSEYLLPTVFLSNSPVQTAPIALVAFAGRHDTQFNLLAAGTLFLILPVVAALVVAYGPAGRGLRRLVVGWAA